MQYKGLEDNVIVNTGRSNGYGIPISVWVWDNDREDYLTAYESTVCADSHYECLDMALVGAGFDYDTAAALIESWGIELPEEDED